MRALPFAAALLAGCAILPAQPPARPDSAPADRRPDAERRQVERDYVIRRFGDPLPGDGADRVQIFRYGPGDFQRRSAIGVLLGDADAGGLRVARVTVDGPAARAGIAAGDRLVAVDGTPLRLDQADAGDPLLAAVPARRLERAVGRRGAGRGGARAVGRLAPGSEVEFRFVRDGRERAVRVRTVAPNTLADAGPARVAPLRPGAAPDASRRFEFFDLDTPGRDSASGVRRRVRIFADSARERAAARPALGVTLGGTGGARDTLGLFVSAVAPGGPAERAGVVEGDRVAALNSVDVRVPRDERDAPEAAAARRARFTRELARLRPGDRATLRLWGDGRWRTVTATVGRSGDVYRGAAAFGFGELAPGALPRGDFFRGDVLRFAPPGALPPGGVPEVREFLEFRTPQRLRAPVSPVQPARPLRPVRPLPPRGPARTVTI